MDKQYKGPMKRNKLKSGSWSCTSPKTQESSQQRHHQESPGQTKPKKGQFDWKRGKDPHPQDKIQHLDFTKAPQALYYKTLPVYFTTKMSVFRSLARTKLALSKTGRFLGEAEILGVGVFSPLFNSS